MWLEAKILISIIGMIFVAIVLSQIIMFNFLLGFLLFAVMGLMVFDNMLIGYQIKHNHLDILIDPCPPGQENCILFDFSGNVTFVRTRKGPLGARQFVRYKKEATIINDGSYQVRFINGNHGFIGHESYDKNVNLYKAEAFDKLKGDRLKEVLDNLPLEDITPHEKEKLKQIREMIDNDRVQS